MELLENTTSQIFDFCQREAVALRGLKNEKRIENPLSFDRQKEIIIEILSRCFLVQKNSQIEIMFDLKNSRMQRIEKNYKNFSVVMKSAFDEIMHVDEENQIFFETINLQKLFEVIKTRNVYSVNNSYSIFFKENKIIIDSQKNSLTIQNKINYEFQVENIERETYIEIVEGISAHWQSHMTTILDHIAAGQYVTDKKDLWLAILANSNFGKSKLFKWMSGFGGSAFVDYKDMIQSGPSDIAVEKIMDKLCLVVDEVLTFKRELYKIEDYLVIRPMREHSVEVPIGSRILLSADGGSFNANHAEEQEVNRVALIDLRNTESRELGEIEISKRYGKFLIEKVMEHYLYVQLQNRIEKYESMSNIERANHADQTIKTINMKFRRQKKNFFEAVEESIYEILNSKKSALDSKNSEILFESLVRIETSTKKGYIIQRASSVLKKILSNYDDTLAYELQFKSINQIASRISGFEEGRHKVSTNLLVRGLYVPDREKEVEKEVEKVSLKSEKDEKFITKQNGDRIPILWEKIDDENEINSIF